MRYLWLTLADPWPPYNGQYLYSGGLIKAVAESGPELVVHGLERHESVRRGISREGPIEWRLCAPKPHSLPRRIAAALPSMAFRCSSAAMRRRLQETLEGSCFDVVVFDSLSAGWALDPVLAWLHNAGPRPKLVYVSHNHEASLRGALAREQPTRLRQWAYRLDAAKVSRLERRMVACADIVTGITPEDAERYRALWPGKRIETLTPGYGGELVAARQITDATPRRAVIVGSFEWSAKQQNLTEFLTVADPMFAAAGVELEVVGSGERSFFNRLERCVTATRFTGTVDSVEEHMAQARIAVVPERNGGGFKLKLLDYVFNRIPVVALAGTIAGVPLRDPESVLIFSDQASLAQGVLSAMDDLDRLNRMQERAFMRCRNSFDWGNRGRDFVAWAGTA